MAIMEIRIIERTCQTQPEYKYTFEVWKDEKVGTSEWQHGTNHIAEHIIQNPIKVQKQMEKFGGVNVKEKLQDYYWAARPYTYTYFKTIEEAEKAKEWLDSMIINLTIVGREELRRQQKEKSVENREKKIQKALNKLLPFKDKEVIINIDSYIGDNKFVIKGTIDNIQRKNNNFILEIGENVISYNYSYYTIINDKINITNTGMSSNIVISLK